MSFDKEFMTAAKDFASSKQGQNLMQQGKKLMHSNPYTLAASTAFNSEKGQKIIENIKSGNTEPTDDTNLTEPISSTDTGAGSGSGSGSADTGAGSADTGVDTGAGAGSGSTDTGAGSGSGSADTGAGSADTGVDTGAGSADTGDTGDTGDTVNTAVNNNKINSGLIKSTMNSVQDFSRMTNVEKVNFTFKNIYYLLLLLIVILIILLVFSIFMLPLIILYKKYQEQNYINMNIDVPINLLLKYEISNYIWCTYDTFFENSSNFQTYKYYIPIVIIYLISFIISIILMVAFINFIIVIYMLFTEDIQVEQAYDKDIAIIGKFLASFTLILISLWVIFYLVFQFTFMSSINEITRNNHYTDVIISDIVFDKNIFKDKNILDKFLTDILINKKNIKDTMKDFYNKYQFSDDSKSKFITLYPIFNYLNNNNLDYSEKNPDFIYKIKAYFMNPHENKDNLVGFISQKNNITPNSYINTELLKDIFGDEKNNSYSNIKKLATDKYVTIVKNLNKSNQSMDNSNVTLYSIILLISIIIIISLLIFLAKYSF
jgi:hypothetical protein